MLRLNNVIRLRYLAFILGWIGYASGLHAAPLQLESVPLSLILKVEPNLILMIDDSDSMNWEVSTGDLVNDGRYTGTQRDGSSPAGSGQVKHRDNNDDGTADCSFGTAPGSPPPAGQSLYGYAYGVEFPTNGDPSPLPHKCNTADDAEWRFRNHNFNPLYFNPNLTYRPWAGVDAAGNPFQDMNIHAAKDNPYDPNSRTIDLTRNNSQGDPNVTSDRNGDSIPDGFRYYTWTDANGNDLFDDGEETVHFIKDEPQNYQNFANWFSYYRKREYVVKAVYGNVLATMSGTRVGLVTLHNNANISPFSPNSSVTTINLPLQSIDLDAQAPTQPNTDPARGNRRRALDALYSFRTQGGTPLRATLNAIGQYLENETGHALFPNDDAYLTSANGGACQQSFVILMTDGIDTSTDAVMGNTDAVPSADENDSAFKPGFNGGPYADIPSNTLADVAMHYYQRDLRGLDDIVPISQLDQARHQHMVTYTITFDGFNGTLTRDPFPNEHGPTFWPQNFSDDKSRIDDLRHAAFNGRGQFLQATEAASLSDALRQALTSIAQRTSSAASVALNTGALTTFTRLFQTRFDSGDWSGQLLSIKLDPTTSAPLTNAPDILDSGALLDQRLSNSNYNTSVRTILTYKPSPTGSGIPFAWSDLDAAQKAALDLNISGVVDNLGQERLTYLRGGNADEGQGHHFRVRAHRLGDIIDSDPFFVGPPALPEEVDATFTDPSRPYVQFRDDPTNRNRPKMILVGSNDGMLHIFNANNPPDPSTGQGDDNAGQELLAYVPNSVLKHTVDLTSPTYRHRYYVNGSPTGGDVFLSNRGWRTVAVGGLGAGGQGYFALDITSPATFREDQASNIVLWEFTDADDPDLGLTFSQPSLVRMKNSQWAAVVGNGYNNADPTAGTDTHVSPTGRAMFFVLFLDGPGAGGTWSEGVNYIKIDTGVGDTTTPNGLATPAAVDIDADFTVDYLVAGDLRGNLWRIDVTSANPSDWKLEANRKLLFTATDSNGIPQPITSRPEVGKHPQNLGGFVVYVGTGKYLEKSDTSTVGATTQSFYGIWDKNLPGDPPVARSELLQQTVIASPTVTDAAGNPRLTRVTSDNPIAWNVKRGFFLDLPAPGEKQVSNSVLRSGRIIFSTLIPNDQPCHFGGTSFLFALDVQGGTQLDSPFFDISNDRLFNDQDMATVNGQLVPFSALQSEVGIIKTPALIPGPSGSSDLTFSSGADGVPQAELTNRSHEPAGRQAWRKITQ